MTAGYWFYTVTYETDDDDVPDFWLETLDISCDGDSFETLHASARNKRFSVGPYPASICAGWHEVNSFDARTWSVRFVKEASADPPPPDPNPIVW